MNLEALKLEFIQKILAIKDETLMLRLYATLEENGQLAVMGPDLGPYTAEQMKKDIVMAMEDLTAGRVIEANALKEKVKQWK